MTDTLTLPRPLVNQLLSQRTASGVFTRDSAGNIHAESTPSQGNGVVAEWTVTNPEGVLQLSVTRAGREIAVEVVD